MLIVLKSQTTHRSTVTCDFDRNIFDKNQTNITEK